MDLTEWWLSQFSMEERKLIYSLFQPLGGNSELGVNSFNIYSESPYGFLDNLCGWLRHHEVLQGRVRLKADEVASTDGDCDLIRLRESNNYKNWYYGKITVLENYKKYLDIEYIFGFEWLGSGSKFTPTSCKLLNGKKWNKNDPAFYETLNEHFSSYTENCCCDIIPVLDSD